MVLPRASAQSVGARRAPIRRRSAAPSLRAGLRHAEPLFARYELQPQPRLSAIPPSQQTRSRSPFSEPRPRVGPATGDGDRTRPPPPGNFRAPHPKGGQMVAFLRAPPNGGARCLRAVRLGLSGLAAAGLGQRRAGLRASALARTACGVRKRPHALRRMRAGAKRILFISFPLPRTLAKGPSAWERRGNCPRMHCRAAALAARAPSPTERA